MVAAVKERNTPEIELSKQGHDLAAGAKVLAGTIGVLNATGYAEPATTATGLKVLGRAEKTVDNTTGADGDEKCEFKKGTFRYENDGSINRTHIESTCYLVDDQTVAATDGTGTRSAAGKIANVDANGVWVTFD
jgi:hypothetical protein